MNRAKQFSKFTFIRFSMQDQAMFAKRLSMLIRAGVSVYEAVKMLGQSANSPSHRALFESMAKDIAEGQFLSKAMGKHRKVFGDFAINIVYVGETSGTLSDNLRYLSEEIDKKRRLRAKVLGALLYPAVIMIAALGVSGLMTAYLFPKLLPVFRSLNVTLPLTTRALLFISNILVNDWAYIIGSIILFVIACIFAMRFNPIRRVFNRITLRLPFVGSLLQYYHLINICRTLGILFKSQVRVLEAVTITGATTTNLVYRAVLDTLHGYVAKGGTISKHFEKNPKLFPRMLTQMISVGEATGNLSDTLVYLGEIYEAELDEQTKRLSSVIEPATMIIMGLMVGFIAISIITPIYEVTQHLSPK